MELVDLLNSLPETKIERTTKGAVFSASDSLEEFEILNEKWYRRKELTERLAMLVPHQNNGVKGNNLIRRLEKISHYYLTSDLFECCGSYLGFSTEHELVMQLERSGQARNIGATSRSRVLGIEKDKVGEILEQLKEGRWYVSHELEYNTNDLKKISEVLKFRRQNKGWVVYLKYEEYDEFIKNCLHSSTEEFRGKNYAVFKNSQDEYIFNKGVGVCFKLMVNRVIDDRELLVKLNKLDPAYNEEIVKRLMAADIIRRFGDDHQVFGGSVINFLMDMKDKVLLGRELRQGLANQNGLDYGMVEQKIKGRILKQYFEKVCDNVYCIEKDKVYELAKTLKG